MDRLRRYGLLAGLVVLAITGPAGAATAKTTKLTKAEKAKIKPCAKNGWKSLLRGESMKAIGSREGLTQSAGA